MQKLNELIVEGLPTGKLMIGDIWRHRTTLTLIIDLTANGRVVYALSYQAHMKPAPLLSDISESNLRNNLETLVTRQDKSVLPDIDMVVGDGYFNAGEGNYYQIMMDTDTNKYFSVPCHGYVSSLRDIILYDTVALLLTSEVGQSWESSKHLYKSHELMKLVGERIDKINATGINTIGFWTTKYPEAFIDTPTPDTDTHIESIHDHSNLKVGQVWQSKHGRFHRKLIYIARSYYITLIVEGGIGKPSSCSKATPDQFEELGCVNQTLVSKNYSREDIGIWDKVSDYHPFHKLITDI